MASIFEVLKMKRFRIKILQFPKNRKKYPYETQILTVVLFYYSLLGLLSYASTYFTQVFIYTRPFWLFIALLPLFFMEITLRVKNISKILHATLIVSTVVVSPLGLYLSGSIITPGSLYLLIVLVNVCLLSEGRKRFIYFSSLLFIVLMFILIENFFPYLLFFPPPTKEANFKQWSIVYVGVVLVVYREVSSVVSVLSIHRQKLTQSNQDLYHENIIDSLTNVFNKKYLQRTLIIALQGLRRQNSSLGILLLDIDNFKAYNDKYGHLEGDNCLIKVTSLIRGCLQRENDKLFRFGGEEFVLVLESITLKGAIVVAKKIQNALRQKKIPHGHSLVQPYVTVSIGIAVFTNKHAHFSTDDLIKYPDEAMYEAKKSGRNQYKVSSLNKIKIKSK